MNVMERQWTCLQGELGVSHTQSQSQGDSAANERDSGQNSALVALKSSTCSELLSESRWVD